VTVETVQTEGTVPGTAVTDIVTVGTEVIAETGVIAPVAIAQTAATEDITITGGIAADLTAATVVIIAAGVITRRAGLIARHTEHHTAQARATHRTAVTTPLTGAA